MGCGRTNLVWIISLTAFVAFCLVSTASAQDSSQDQAAIEQALRDALPKEGDLAPGLPWEEEDTSYMQRDSGFLQPKITYNSHYDIPTSDPNPSYQDDYHQTQSINAEVRWFSNTIFESGDDHRSHWLMQLPTMLPGDAIVEAYEGLPGGVIAHYSSRTGDQMHDIYYEIYYYRDSKIDGSIHYSIGTFCMDGCQKWCPGEVEKADALARSECERLARLVYCRLPGSGECDGICLPTGKFGIKGDVLEVGLFTPIPNSKVTITKDGNVFRVVTPNAEDGSYFVPLEPGTYGVIASAPGYISSEGMSEDHVVVTSGVNTTYNLRLLEMPPVANNTSVEPPVEYVPYHGEDAATIVIGNEQICNTGAYSRCSGEEGCSGLNVGTSYGLCILNATIGDKEAKGIWSVPSQLGSVGCVEMTGVTSIEALKPNEWSYSVPAGTYTIVEYLFVSEVNPGFSGVPCRHWWLKPPKVIDLQPGETRRFVNSADEWSGDSICTPQYFDCSKCLQFFPGFTLGNGIVA